MAVLAAAQLLDELMGRHRNTNPNEKIKKPNWEDPEVIHIFIYYNKQSFSRNNIGTWYLGYHLIAF